MSETLGQPVVVENKVGASGNVATAEVAKSAHDGYTLLAHSSAYAVNPTLFSNPGYDPVKDLLAIAVVAQQANIILVNSSFPAKTLDELKKAMAQDKLAFASPGAGHHAASHRREPVPRALEGRRHARSVQGRRPCVTGLLSGQPPIGCMAGSGRCRTSRPASSAPSPCPRPSACRSSRTCRR
jgi:tripartite-type tricarboxylate transporter receptor subunit TctC